MALNSRSQDVVQQTAAAKVDPDRMDQGQVSGIRTQTQRFVLDSSGLGFQFEALVEAQLDGRKVQSKQNWAFSISR